MKYFRKSGKFSVACVLLGSVLPESSNTSAIPIWNDVKIFFSELFYYCLEESRVCGHSSDSGINNENKSNRQVQKGINSKNVKCKEKSSKKTLVSSGKAIKKSFGNKKKFKENKEEVVGRVSKFSDKIIKNGINNKEKLKKDKEKFDEGVSESFNWVANEKKGVKEFLNKVRSKRRFYEDKDDLCENFETIVSEQTIVASMK